MSSNAQTTLIKLISESVLALYPILIKNVDVNLTTQLVGRLGTFSVLALLLSNKAERTAALTNTTVLETILYNALNLFHIAVSYSSYTLLPAGNALALFYTYPFWTVLAGWLFLGEKFDPRILGLLIIAGAGTWLVAKNSKIETYEDMPNTNTSYGVFLGLLSAITETLIYLIAKTPANPSPMMTILKLYPYAALATLGYGLYKKDLSTNVRTGWLPLILFNVFIGFVGYAFNFYVIPFLSAGTFSVLTFVGVVSAFIWQLLFTEEKANPIAILGSTIISASVGLLYFLKPV